MKILSLEIKGKEYKAYIMSDGYGSYEYTLFEIVPKKHWWSFRRCYIGCGIIKEDIEGEIFDHIGRVIKKEEHLNCLTEQFNKL